MKYSPTDLLRKYARMREILLMQQTLTRRYNKLVKEANAMEKRKED